VSLPTAPYLVNANVQDSNLRYEWDDWKTLPALETTDERLVTQLHGLSYRAVLAFACGTAEWLCQRFERLCDDSAPWNFLEAAWAMIVDIHYAGCGGVGWQEYAGKHWKGPVKGPIDEALKTLEIAFQQLSSEYHTDPTIFAALLSTLTLHVMSDAVPFKTWSGQILSRLEAIYPRISQDKCGDVVPREAMNPEVDFQVDQSEALVSEFLAKLDYRSNPFLSSPDGMLQTFEGEESFPGTPYRFSMKLDRDRRRESTSPSQQS
jgi:hypothetical protein